MPDYDAPYSLPSELLQDAKDASAELEKLVEHAQHGYLVHREMELLRFTTETGRVESLSGRDLLLFLNPIVRSRTVDSWHYYAKAKKDPTALSLSTKGGRTIWTFILAHFYELRDLVCKGKKKTYPLTTNQTAIIVLLGDWLVRTFGAEPHIVKSIAVAILVAILAATKGAFCKLTRQEAELFWSKIESN